MLYYIQKKGNGFEFEMCRQVKFRIIADENRREILGGVGIYGYDDNQELYLVNVICGHCGVMFEPDEVEVLEIYKYWTNISEEIIGN